MRRLAEFIRSVIPADPFQLFFLGGSVLLFICMQLRCFPVIPSYKPGISVPLQEIYDDPLAKIHQSWQMFSFWARLPLLFAGAAGLFLCFWPGKHPVRRILIFVCLPAISGIGALCARFLYISRHAAFPFVSVLQKGQHNEVWVIRALWSMGPALHMGFLGLALVLIFVSRLVIGIASLPLSLAEPDDVTLQQQDDWNRIQIVIWISIAGISVIMVIAWNLVLVLYRVLFLFVDYHLLPDNASLTVTLGTAMLAGVAAWAAGERRWRNLQRFIRLPEVSFGMLGAVLPIAINLFPNLLLYLKDRIHWATFEFGRFAPPLFSSYFQFPQAFYFWYLPAAAFEEIIWRGYLQPHFVRRFGVARGIFLLGLVWSAFHFIGDFQKTAEDYQVLLKLAFRLFSCVVLAYVFGWLTLRSGSIWPAALAHGFHNVSTLSNAYWIHEQYPWLVKIIPWVCWGLLAVLLFRFWPPTAAEDDFAGAPEIQAESAD